MNRKMRIILADLFLFLEHRVNLVRSTVVLDDHNTNRSSQHLQDTHRDAPSQDKRFVSLWIIILIGRQPTLLYGPPFNSTHHNGYKYAAPSRHERNPLLDVESSTKYHPQQHSEYPIFSQAPSLKSFKQDRTWWMNNGYVRSNKMAPQTFHENPLLQYVNLKTERTKRQMNTDTVALCPTEAQYITPKAALNNRGNWMYVVNLAEQDDKYSQLVKSEKCSTNTCNGLCSLPAGYTSTCQQQFVQKRLVALEGSGNRLYTDIFWFPHGCSCHVRFNGL
ncbi:uncharacterized protein LOC124952765 isoform X2 [Vespa velutina]|uniref:uncharacterized protein LOC124952765 isoform X2 n=1 Tax=Vespa velutina TaxID=202808 RepID=UPI001FB550DC|nr:uncharacterized protein LOC124952765 isoform X2 [Vespa velutina]